MSNTKSRYMDRRTGRHLIGTPPKQFSARYEDREEQIHFIRSITEAKTDVQAITKFMFILKQFKTNTDLLGRLAVKVNMEKHALANRLTFYMHKYEDHIELYDLFGLRSW